MKTNKTGYSKQEIIIKLSNICVREGNVFLPGFHGQRSRAGYSPWSHRVGHD